jgi:uncharacterized protein
MIEPRRGAGSGLVCDWWVTTQPASSPDDTHAITTPADLERVLGVAHPDVLNKHTSSLTPLIVEYLRHARFFVLATADADGNCDCSPRGDVDSAVLVPDPHTLVLPDRMGNRRVDSYRNILANPHVGVLFMVPGIDEVIRVNGRARLRTDPDLLDAMAIKGKSATLAVVIDIDEVYVHCARAILRSDLWNPERFADPDVVPTVRDILVEQHAMPVPADEPRRQEPYRSHLY